ncbi:MAG TPA: tetratricopeptide repeat protein [Bryobacteraceae bacterium]|nr:tetratricopeptide repeat protein [Bryobacteraceae bacterium]
MQRLAILALVFSSLPGFLYAETTVVLPFFNHTSSDNLDWIGESIAESVHDALASEGALVLDRGDRLEAYRRLSLRPGAELTHASILKIGESLDASNVVYGSFELLPPDGASQSKGSLRISARILDLKHVRQSAVFGELGALEDLSALEDHLGWQTLTQLDPKSSLTAQEFLKARPPVRIDAVENYIRGLLAVAPEQRHRLFTQAARLDAHYSPPCFQLGKAYWERKEYKLASPWLERVARTDPHYLYSQFLLGLCRYHSADFAGAEQALAGVASTMPLNEVYNNLGAAQDRQHHADAAAESFRKALEGDSGDPDYYFNLGVAQWRGGHYQEAAQSFAAVLERNAKDTEATELEARARRREGPRAGDARDEARERLKTNYDEAAYRQLQAELSKAK